VHEVAVRTRRLVRRRIATPAFHPNAAQRVLDAGPGVFAVRRGGGAAAPVLALTNVTARAQEAVLARDQLDSPAAVWRDRITGRERRADPRGTLWLSLGPYEVLWLTPDDDAAPPAP
jgi:sucrose phosphorylase